MNQAVLDYLNTQRIGVIAIEMLDGSPHGATVHFAHQDEPFIFYFETNKNYRKSEPLLGREISRATFVIGSDEASPKTLQLDGVVSLISDEEKANFEQVYFGKFPEKVGKYEGPDVVLFKFTPTWWRFTDYTQPKDQRIITSS